MTCKQQRAGEAERDRPALYHESYAIVLDFLASQLVEPFCDVEGTTLQVRKVA